MRSGHGSEMWIYLVIIPLIALVIASLPLLLIWAINTLFGVGISFTIATYGAAAFLLVMSTAAVSLKRD